MSARSTPRSQRQSERTDDKISLPLLSRKKKTTSALGTSSVEELIRLAQDPRFELQHGNPPSLRYDLKSEHKVVIGNADQRASARKTEHVPSCHQIE